MALEIRQLPISKGLFTFARMTERAPSWRLFLMLLLSFSFLGCGPLRRGSVDEEKEPQFIEGKRRLSRMDWDKAIESFERALQANPYNAAAHLELGVLYDQKKNDYAAAIYHYQRHLMLRTNSPMAEVVKQNIIACTRELAKTVQYAVVTREVQRELERLTQSNSVQKARIEFLQAELSRRPQYITNYITNFVGLPQVDPRASSSRLTQPTQPLVNTPEPDRAAESAALSHAETPHGNSQKPIAQKNSRTAARPIPTISEKRPAQAVVPPPSGTRSSHTVRPGETLASLANAYGVSLQALKAANPGSAGGVRAGQKINIPK
jgi:LysM repeat protein